MDNQCHRDESFLMKIFKKWKGVICPYGHDHRSSILTYEYQKLTWSLSLSRSLSPYWDVYVCIHVSSVQRDVFNDESKRCSIGHVFVWMNDKRSSISKWHWTDKLIFFSFSSTDVWVVSLVRSTRWIFDRSKHRIIWLICSVQFSKYAMNSMCRLNRDGDDDQLCIDTRWMKWTNIQR